jgi:hypothetical protein
VWSANARPLPTLAAELERIAVGATSTAPVAAMRPVRRRKLALLSFHLSSIQRPPSCAEKTARRRWFSITHSGAPSLSRSALQVAVRPRGRSTARIGNSMLAPPVTRSFQ